MRFAVSLRAGSADAAGKECQRALTGDQRCGLVVGVPLIAVESVGCVVDLHLHLGVCAGKSLHLFLRDMGVVCAEMGSSYSR